VNKRTLLLFSILIILLVISYFGYQKYDEYRRSARKKAYPTHVVQQEQDVEEEDVPLTIQKARFQLESADNVDRVRLIVEGSQRDIKYRYEWFRNDIPFGADEDSVTGFKKGDRIDVKVTPFDDERTGQPRLLSFTIARVPPKIVENKTMSFEGDVLSYQVKAIDPDGGTLTYALADAPKGMTIDSRTGMIRWPVKAEDRRKCSVNVTIKSSSGAETVYPLSFDIGKAEE
jgi:hypothetical protein